jgi:hypothetical protein
MWNQKQQVSKGSQSSGVSQTSGSGGWVQKKIGWTNGNAIKIMARGGGPRAKLKCEEKQGSWRRGKEFGIKFCRSVFSSARKGENMRLPSPIVREKQGQTVPDLLRGSHRRVNPFLVIGFLSWLAHNLRARHILSNPTKLGSKCIPIAHHRLNLRLLAIFHFPMETHIVP